MNDDTLMTLSEIQEGLRDKRLYRIGKTVGLSYPTLKKLEKGEHPNPTRDTLVKITKYLRNQ